MDELNYILKPDSVQRFKYTLNDRHIGISCQKISDIDEHKLKQIHQMINDNFSSKTKLYNVLRYLDNIIYAHYHNAPIASLFVSGCTVKEIHYVVTHHSWRGQGIASELVNFTTDMLKTNNHLIKYFTLSSKPELRSLYEGKCGFTVI